MNHTFSEPDSLINHYFTLADGLATGLENYLAENVILDWFGKTIKGRTNVAAFMNKHKINSRHVFDDVISTNSIGYNKKRTRSNRRRTLSFSKNTLNTSGNIIAKNRLNNAMTPENETVSNGDRSRSSKKINSYGNYMEESDITIELYDDDVSTLFKLENIKSTNVEEIEEKINQISLEGRLNIKSPKKQDYKEFDKSEIVSVPKSTMKFVEAHGEILFSKRSRRQNLRSDSKLILSSSSHTWRKPSKLQIAYSQNVYLPQESSTNNIEYLRNYNCNHGKDGFLKNFSNNEADKFKILPKYIEDQLIFQKINCDNEDTNNYKINNLIHVIIYEGISRCRMNLSQKFI